MSILLKELLDMEALPYKWIDNERCVFKFEDIKFGIYAEYQELDFGKTEWEGIDFGNKKIDIVNISFGIFNTTFRTASDLNTSITNFGKPRTILSTVAEACLANSQIINSDIIALAASDQAKEKRFNIYQLALSEIRQKVKMFNNETFNIQTSNGTKIALLSKVILSDSEREFVKEKIGIDKL